jgi:hypothetical protein
MPTHSGEVFVKADSQEDAVKIVEKHANKQGLDLIDHRTYAIGYTPDHYIGNGKDFYRDNRVSMMPEPQPTFTLVERSNWLLTIAAFIAGALIVSAIIGYIGRDSENE